jgi:dihydrofolate reductase
MRKVILYIAMSLDGYIAKPDGDISFLQPMEQKGLDYGYSDFLKSVDTIIVGRKTFDVVLNMGFHYPDNKKVYVISKTPRPGYGSVHYYSGSLKDLIINFKSEPGKNIYCDGGSVIVNELLGNNLIDEFIISVIPVILGNGIQLFTKELPEINIELIDCKKFNTGLVQLHYKRINHPIR